MDALDCCHLISLHRIIVKIGLLSDEQYVLYNEIINAFFRRVWDK